MKRRGVLALVIPPNGQAYPLRLDPDERLAANELHVLVDGDLEVVLGDDWAAYVDENYQRNQRPGNASADHLLRVLGWQSHPSEFLCGTVVVVGRDRTREIDCPVRILRYAGVVKPAHGGQVRLRFRLFVDGEMVDEQWLPDPKHRDAGERLADRHRTLTDQANAAGKRWLIELHDPAEPDGSPSQHMRWGTDTDGMVLPLLVVGGDPGYAWLPPPSAEPRLN